MFLRRLLVFGYPLIEILLLWWVASLIGWGFALLLLIAGFPAGAAIMRNAAAKVALMQETPEAQRPKIARDSAMMFTSGLLVMIPGYLTDIIGIVLLVPFVRSRVVTWIGSWMSIRMMRVPGFSTTGFSGAQFASYVDGEVIQGVVIKEETDERPHGNPPASLN